MENNYSLRNYLRCVYSIINAVGNQGFYILILLMVVGSILEFIGIGSIFPYIAIISNPKIIHTNYYLKNVYQFFEFKSDFSFIIFFGITVFFFIFLKAIFTVFNNYYQAKFSANINNRLSRIIFNACMLMKYDEIQDSNTAYLLKYIVYDVQNTAGVITAMLNMSANLMMGVALLILMLWVNPILVLCSASFLGGFIALTLVITRNKMNQKSKENEQYYKRFYADTTESLKSIKDIQIAKTESYFSDRFMQTQTKLSKHNIIFSVISNMPNVVANTMSFCVMIVVVIFLLAIYHNILSFLPIIAIIGLSVQRLLPIVNMLTTSLTVIRRYKPVVFLISERIIDAKAKIESSSQKTLNEVCFKHTISLSNICVSYGDKTILQNLNIDIHKGKVLAIFGPSGVGKSTLVDIILGLRSATSGKVYVDGSFVSSFKDQFTGKISYVPQHVHMLDSTIAENIVFGRDSGQMNSANLRKALEVSQLSQLIETFNDDIYEMIGEEATKLSGGQRQRLGIARAIYADPDVLILDEATSALDTKTEHDFYRALLSWSNEEKTIIIISHKPSIFDYCDEVLELCNNSQAKLSSCKKHAVSLSKDVSRV